MARSKEAFIKDCVLTSVADALESFSSIVEEVTAWAAEKQIPVVRDDVLKALQDLIDNGYVQAYICSANPPSTRAIPCRGRRE